MRATPTVPLPSPCRASQFGSTLIRVPAPGTENDDHNPQRIKSRSLFDIAVGADNIFKGDRYQWSPQVNLINFDQQLRAIQLSFDIQRDALRDAENRDSSVGISFLRELLRVFEDN
jgi:hypothetical protein